jgi:DNA polymerase-3 subunit gamma/tau
MDVIEIDGASNTSVNDVRQIKDEVLFPPNSGNYKIYIIDEVHMLSNSAFNALLKTIEEPPPYIVFIFATTELHKVPATIKSRCQQFAFKLIPIETIKSLLAAVCEELSIEAEDEALFWIARESTGSLRDAYTLFDQVASFSEGHIRTALIREKLGLVGLDNMNAIAEACVACDTGAAFALLDDVIENGVSIEQFIIDLAGFYRSLLLLKSGVTRESLLGYAPERFSAKIIAALDLPRIEQGLKILLETHRAIRYSVSPRFELETAVAELCVLPKWVSGDDLRTAIEGVRSLLGINPAMDRRGATEIPDAGHAASGQSAGSASSRSITDEFKRRIAERGNSIPEKVESRPDGVGTVGIMSPEVGFVEKVFQATVVSEEPRTFNYTQEG